MEKASRFLGKTQAKKGLFVKPKNMLYTEKESEREK